MQVTIHVEHDSHWWVIEHEDGGRSTHRVVGDFDLQEFIVTNGISPNDTIIVTHLTPEHVDDRRIRPRYRCVTRYSGDGCLVGDVTSEYNREDAVFDAAAGLVILEPGEHTSLPDGYYYAV